MYLVLALVIRYRFSINASLDHGS